MRIGLEDARSGETYLCEHCPSEVRYNAGYEAIRRGASVVVEHYFKLRQHHVHAVECAYNIEAQIRMAVRDSDPAAVRQLDSGRYELRLMFPESSRSTPPSSDSVRAFGSTSSSNRGRNYVSSGKLNSYLNTAERILKIRNYCEEHADIERYLVLSFDGREIGWSEFYIEQDEYAYIYGKMSEGSVDYPMAVSGIVKEINERRRRQDPTQRYWVLQLVVRKTMPDGDGVVTKVDAHAMTSRQSLVSDLRPGDSVIIFGEWQARPPTVRPNKSKNQNSRVKQWRDLPLRFSLSHPKQIVRVSSRRE